jgi:hypothetical protein
LKRAGEDHGMARKPEAQLLTPEQRAARLDEVIARYERRGWKIAIRLDTRAELIGRGTRRRYLELGADGTLVDRILEEQVTGSAKRARRGLGRTGSALLLVGGLIAAVAIGFSLSGSRNPQAVDVAEVNPTPTESAEQTLAATQQGDGVADDALVASFADKLDTLQQYCTESRDELAQFALDANQRLAASGTDESLSATVDAMTHAVEGSGAPPDTCQERLEQDLTRRGVNP